ncbi:MAG: hypothetical protein GX415_00185 [Chloroflexi bacterium]|jgi:CO/xanthine dehydrogenase FAD-binding subunit|nr:FAD binding domain-containing protein [Anaerolineaceae bacterium]NLI43830.1 hypothetical protein [Chloroflexota bacterium]HOE35011.1 FAD binding domain-containing protein [Anaerolineaceae bacterium]HOT25945.1 FAD binding domain-containing protein [Anaerolineaceae bacterium]HQK03568.1 FAD binding domain-containing protein [Anaerolineaceae bacterium]
MNTEDTRYIRPKNLQELEALLKQKYGRCRILAGGAFSPARVEADEILIDLQDAGLNQVVLENDTIRIGAAASLQQILEGLHAIAEIREPLEIEAGLNVRESLSLLNYLRTAETRSPFLTALLALTPEVELIPSGRKLALEAFLGQENTDSREIPIYVNFQYPKGFAWESIARAPKDRPIICVTVGRNKSGRLRVACGGNEAFPRIIETEARAEGLFTSVRKAYEHSADAWASEEYRQEMSQILLSRCLRKLGLIAEYQEEK